MKTLVLTLLVAGSAMGVARPAAADDFSLGLAFA